MAGFRTHITASTALGVGYAAGAHYFFGVPPETCVLAGGLCSVSGMLPDLDSDSGVPLRESVAFAAAAVPVMMIRRFERLGMPLETMILAGMGIYLVLRFGLATLLKKYTVHRGMFHSLPAALIAAEVAFLIFDRDDLWLRYYVAGAVLLGFLSHLVLDEIWSIGFRRGLPRLKKSFGTAMKIWGDSLWANVSTYAKVILLTYLVAKDPQWMAQFGGIGSPPHELAGRPAQSKVDNSEVMAIQTGAGDISATPPVYYDPAQVGSRNRDGRWR
jgi:membrane-bound metal-dependent hydrolase YbcI (DUF457 family)